MTYSQAKRLLQMTDAQRANIVKCFEKIVVDFNYAKTKKASIEVIDTINKITDRQTLRKMGL